MNKYKIIRILAAVVFIAAFCVWGYTELLYKDAEVTYKDIEKRTVTVEEAPKTDSGSEDSTEDTDPVLKVDIEALRDINKDYVFWLSACGNKVSYPVVQGKTNDEYLHRTFFGDKNFVGSIFVDYRCNADLNDFQTIIYGHSMHDRTMFRLVADYTEPSMAAQYPCIYIYGDGCRARYKIFAVNRVSDNNVPTALGETDEAQRTKLIDTLCEGAMYPLNDKPSEDKSIISLITCDVRDDSKRVMVNAYLDKFDEITE